MNVIQKLGKLEMNRSCSKNDISFQPMANIKVYHKRSVWNHIQRISLFIIFFLIGGALGYVGFSYLFFYTIKIVSQLK